MDKLLAMAVILWLLAALAGPSAAQDITVDPDGMVVITGDVCDALPLDPNENIVSTTYDPDR